MLVEILFTLADVDDHRFAPFQLSSLMRGSRAGSAHSYISSALLLGVVLSVAGCALRLMCYRELGKLFVFEASIHPEHKLITSGPYGVVRHPSYTALALLKLGTLLSLCAPGSWWAEVVRHEGTLVRAAIVGFWAYLTVYSILVCSRAVAEDSMLKRAFGKEWEEYARVVRYRFVPGVC